jgi:hypothetical protein
VAEKSVESMLTLIGGITGTGIEAPSTGLGKLNLLLEATSLLHPDLPVESVIGSMLDHVIGMCPPVSDTREDIPLGGHGIHLLKEFADALDYEPTPNGNRLTIRFNFPESSAASR